VILEPADYETWLTGRARASADASQAVLVSKKMRIIKHELNEKRDLPPRFVGTYFAN